MSDPDFAQFVHIRAWVKYGMAQPGDFVGEAGSRSRSTRIAAREILSRTGRRVGEVRITTGAAVLVSGSSG